MYPDSEIDWEEAWEYQPGFTIELKARPGVLQTIAYYEPMMVPPIWLEGDPRPRYPHELRVVSRATHNVCHLSNQLAVAK